MTMIKILRFSVLFLLSIHADAIQNESINRFGETCMWDKDCGGGYCVGTFRWKCVECEEDSQCESGGFSPQGKAPDAFCTAEGKCSRWKRGKPLDSKGYPLNFGKLKWIPRKVIDKPTSHELIRFILSDAPNVNIEITATHALIPIDTHIQGEYAIDNFVTGMKESGIINTVYGKNLVSVIFDDPLVGAAEKYNAVKVEGISDTQSYDRVRKEQADRPWGADTLASSYNFHRDNGVTVVGGALGLGSKLVEAAQDITHINQIRNFVKEDGGKKGINQLLSSDQFKSLTTSAKDAKIASKTIASKKSMNHCRHWNEDSGITFTDTHFVIPLETNLLSGVGKVELAPWRWFQVGAGHSVFKYNEEDNALEMFQVITQQSHVNMDDTISTTNLPPNAFWVGPADGMNMKVSKMDGRTDEYYEPELSLVNRALLGSVDILYADYERLYQDPQSVCGERTRKALEPVFKAAKKEESNPNFITDMWQSVSLVAAASDSVDCGVNFLGTPLKNSNAFDILEFAVWGHFILEMYDVNNIYGNHWDDGVIMPASEVRSTNETHIVHDEGANYLRKDTY